MKANEILKESRAVNVQGKLTNDDLDEFRYSLELAADFLNQRAVDNTSVPAGPDSSKFRASIMGNAEVVDNFVERSAYGGGAPVGVYKYYLKMGNGIPKDKHDAAIAKILNFIASMLDAHEPLELPSKPPLFLDFENGYRVSLTMTHGTNFNGIGYMISKK